MGRTAARATGALFSLGLAEVLQPRPFASEPGKPGDASQITAPEADKTLPETTDEERKRKGRALAGTLLTSREARAAKSPSLQPLLSSGRPILG